MNDFKKRIGRIEARILAGRDDTTDADHCAACTWFADAMRTLNAGGELAQIDAAIWNDIFENGIDSTKAWRKWQTTNGALTV